MQLPKISIVTPSFNQGRFLEETLCSVLDQGYPNLEYVVIDGGSSDNSVEIIKKYAHRLHYWVSEKDEGHAHALNKGFAKTSGDIMAWINSDDKYTPWSFKTVAEIFSQFPHVLWILGFASMWNSAGAMTGAMHMPKNIFDFLLGNYAWIQQESVFWRRPLWERAGGFINQHYKLMVDGELWTRFFLHADLYTVDCILGGYRLHSTNRAMQNYNECLREMEQAIATMRQRCPADILRLCRRLQLIQTLRRCWFLKFVPPFRLALLYPWLPSTAHYKNIEFKNDAWRERTIPFLSR